MGQPNRRSANERVSRSLETRVGDPFTLDLQTLLSHSVVRLRDVTQMASAVAWALRPDGTPYVAAASFDGEPPIGPTPAEFATVSTLETVNRLDSSPALIDIAKRHGLSAVTWLGIRQCKFPSLYTHIQRPAI